MDVSTTHGHRPERVAWRRWNQFFRDCLKDHGTVSPILMTAGSMAIPHPVHFREGMQIRNWMRDRPECEGWNDNDFDNRWETAVKAAIGDMI